jgi:hypothetical protein
MSRSSKFRENLTFFTTNRGEYRYCGIPYENRYY